MTSRNVSATFLGTAPRIGAPRGRGRAGQVADGNPWSSGKIEAFDFRELTWRDEAYWAARTERLPYT